MAQLQKIGNKMFYTDGERIFSKECGQVCVWIQSREESEWFCESGNMPARCFEDIVVKPVKEGMTFNNGEITVVAKNEIMIHYVKYINAKYDDKGYMISYDSKELISDKKIRL